MYTHQEVEAALQAWCEHLAFNPQTAYFFKKFVLDNLRPKFTIENLRIGKVAMICDGTKDECQKVLDFAFPNDKADLSKYSFVDCKAHIIQSNGSDSWICDLDQGLPAAPCSVFLSQLPNKWDELQGKANKLKAEIDDYLNSCK